MMTSRQFKLWLRKNSFTYKLAAEYLGLSAITIKRYATGKRYLTGGGYEKVIIPRYIELACKKSDVYGLRLYR